MWRNGSELTERDKKEVLVLKPFWVVWWESGVQILDGRSRKLLMSCSLLMGRHRPKE